LVEILNIYENEFNKLSERYFVEFPWPNADLIKDFANNGESAITWCVIDFFWDFIFDVNVMLADISFIVLYKELQYRHIYAKHKVSWNTCSDQEKEY